MFDPDTYDYLSRNTIAEYIPIAEMFVDRYQRPVKESKINAMIRRGFNPNALASVVLSLRNPEEPYAGLYAIVDGNHRVQAARKVGITHVFSLVLIDQTYEEEAKLFDDLNFRQRLSALDVFRARIEAKELAALEMQGIMHELGMRIAGGNEGLGAVAAVHALNTLYIDLGPRGYREVVSLIHGAWKKERRAWIGVIIDGVKQFWIRYYMEADEKRLVDRLKQVHPEDIIRNAGIAVVKQGSVGTRIGRVIVEHYNSGLRTHRLSDWVDHPGKGYDGRGGRNGKAKPR